MTLKRRFFSAPTLTQALLAAARHHSVDPDAIDYEVVEKKSGFIKAPRGVVIDVDPDAPVKPGVDAERPSAPLAITEPEDEATAELAAEPSEEPTAEASESLTAEADEEPTSEASEEPTAEPPSARAAEVAFEPAAAPEPAEHPALESVESQARRPEASSPPQEEPAREPEPAAEASEEGTRETPAEVASSSPFGERGASVAQEAESDEKEQPTEEAAEPAAAGDQGEASEDLREAVAQAIDELAFLASLRVQASEVKDTDEGLEVELDGPDSERLTARGGRALLAMQHLLPRLLFGRLGKAPRCRLDSQGFHQARGERLERLAQKAADRVRSGGRSWLLEPMAPDERRLVHLALAEVPDIETESVGQGFLKRVRVAQTDSAQT